MGVNGDSAIERTRRWVSRVAIAAKAPPIAPNSAPQAATRPRAAATRSRGLAAVASSTQRISRSEASTGPVKPPTVIVVNTMATIVDRAVNAAGARMSLLRAAKPSTWQ